MQPSNHDEDVGASGHGILIPLLRPAPIASATKPYLVASATIAVAGVLIAIGVFVSRPEQENVTLLTFVVGFTLTVLASVMAYLKAQETHLSVNSRLDEMVRNARLAAHAEGLAQGKVKGAAAANTRTDAIKEKRRRPSKERR